MHGQTSYASRRIEFRSAKVCLRGVINKTVSQCNWNRSFVTEMWLWHKHIILTLFFFFLFLNNYTYEFRICIQGHYLKSAEWRSQIRIVLHLHTIQHIAKGYFLGRFCGYRGQKYSTHCAALGFTLISWCVTNGYCSQTTPFQNSIQLWHNE
jgi:hypothetical protein